MKKFTLILIAIFPSFLLGFSQNNTMYIMKDGAITHQLNIETEIDSIIFYKPEVEGNGTIQAGTRKYFTSGNQGEVISFTIDGDHSSYSYFNESTQESGSGSLQLSQDPKLKGVFETTVKGKILYTIELPGVAVITSLPLGSNENRICFGISSDIHEENNYTIKDYAGKYVFMSFDDNELDPEYFLGGFEVFGNETYTYGYADSNITDINFDGVGYGTFKVDKTDNSRIFYSDNYGYSGYGSVYPGKAMVIDNGEGYGFSIGVQYPSNPMIQSEIAGSYKMIGIGEPEPHGRGDMICTFTIPESGTDMTYYQKFHDGMIYDSTTDDLIFNSFEIHPTINNLFKTVVTVPDEEEENEPWTVSAYLVMLPGEIMMYFEVEPDGVIGVYGLALKID